MCGSKNPAGRADPGEIVVDADHLHLVTALAKRLDHVVLHLPLGFEDVDPGRVLRRNEMLVDERKDHVSSQEQPGCPPLWR